VLTRDAGFVGQWNRASGERAGWAPRNVEGQISAYRSDAEDLLVFMQNTTSSSVAQNISAARLAGIELAAHAIWAAGFTADVSWTRQWTKDEGDVSYWRGKELPGHPGHEATLRVTGLRGPASAYGELHAIGAFALDRYNQRFVPARALLDLGVTLAFARAGAGITAACHNVGDTQAQDFGGYPLPGRSWALGVQFHLDRKDVAP
jgi:outer membrane receptor protein involved in Fe transport